MIKIFPIIMGLFCIVSHSYSQIANENIIYFVDSIPILKQLDATESSLDPEYISEIIVIKNKDSLKNIGYEKMDGAILIFTKAYRSRPDDIKKIPSTKQMKRNDKRYYLNSSLPYTGNFIDYYYTGIKQGEVHLKMESLPATVKLITRMAILNMKAILKMEWQMEGKGIIIMMGH